ncbi:PIG-L deacetylase family protein [Ornithinimicrobium faecis]|uniref:PIG-L family deacetylase n=1 Tax=Ornithinimicrobium faecis TaxID=2934158 RepID=A0ABY4YQ50_9MICO|nr:MULTISPECIES: PIG-L deacetylase family protein [unclassified Ornithinimicrobium]USQ78907.1 PIG-L family deacetylase [Ornithinimicrobium sp. HY1793]
MDLHPFPDDWQTALCVAAHPDDLEYGTAAAVAGWTAAGKEVSYLLVTRGEAGIDGMSPEEAAPARAQEERDGAAEVGVDRVDFLDDFTDGIVEHGLPLRQAIAAQIRAVRPDLVVTLTFETTFPGGGVNQADHRAVGLAVLDACADAGNRWIFNDLIAEGLEPWSGVRYVAFSATSQPTHYVDVTETFEAGVASLEAHGQYLDALGPDYPSPRELLTSFMATPELAQHGEKVWTAQVLQR